METVTFARIEGGVESVAAAAMAGAMGYATATLLNGIYSLPIVPGLAVAAIVFAVVRAGLRTIPGASATRGGQKLSANPSLTLSDFFELGEPVGTAVESGDRHLLGEELLLDEVFCEPQAKARVVQMFEPQPTAGELDSPIDRHIAARRPATPPDDSDAMVDALHQLRRRLR